MGKEFNTAAETLRKLSAAVPNTFPQQKNNSLACYLLLHVGQK
jgi:hypothetical protein